MTFTVKKIASLINGKLYGKDDILIKGAFDLVPGKKSFVSFLDSNSNIDLLSKSKSDLIITSNKIDPERITKTVIMVDDPKSSFFEIVKK